jgi:hypothetical protein
MPVSTPRTSLRDQMRSGVVPRLHETPPSYEDIVPRAPGVPRVIATGVRDSSPPSSSWRERKKERSAQEEVGLFFLGLVIFLAALMTATYLVYR